MKVPYSNRSYDGETLLLWESWDDFVEFDGVDAQDELNELLSNITDEQWEEINKMLYSIDDE